MSLESTKKAKKLRSEQSEKKSTPIPAPQKQKRIFSLQEAKDLLPLVKKITTKTVEDVNQFAGRLAAMGDLDPDYEDLKEKLDLTIEQWVDRLEGLGCEVKGLWLVDFDNGHGYLCWSHPEADVEYFHGYKDGFAKRMRIC